MFKPITILEHPIHLFWSGNWVRSRYLPRQYRNYDLYNGYKVVLNDYHGRAPYTYYKKHKAKYYKGYKGKPKTIGQRHENHNNYSNVRHKENGRGNGDKDHGNKGREKVMEMENINFIFSLKKETQTAFLFFAASSNSN
jgi:hypothetical protein